MVELPEKHLKLWNTYSYGKKHVVIMMFWGKANECELCGFPHKAYQWANIDHTYKPERKDWAMLCCSCHLKYDFAVGLRVSRQRRKKSV